ncbi:hypothetical protein NPIL_34931 [Nephila pilipes]|uniref:Uncharacterized protein n=1 Tax=Nephila pilipes TaxID=299642 RepID=A0A8X6TSX9_NEPPI|nr:hypothetical protein NPIL_34931 [Nephila pilipes]
MYKTQETTFLSAKLFIKQIKRSTYQDELLSKIKSKYGRNNCLLDILDKPRREALAAFPLFIGHVCLTTHLYRIGILPAPCVTKEMSLWANTTCVLVEFSTKIRNHRDNSRREGLCGDNLP